MLLVSKDGYYLSDFTVHIFEFKEVLSFPWILLPNSSKILNTFLNIKCNDFKKAKIKRFLGNLPQSCNFQTRLANWTVGKLILIKGYQKWQAYRGHQRSLFSAWLLCGEECALIQNFPKVRKAILKASTSLPRRTWTSTCWGRSQGYPRSNLRLTN